MLIPLYIGPTKPPVQQAPGDLSPGVKRHGLEADHSPPPSSEVKNAWLYTSTPTTSSCRLVQHRDDFTIYLNTLLHKSRDSSFGIVLGYGLDDRGSRVRFPEGAGNFFFTTASRMALQFTQPSTQWVPGALSLGIKRPGLLPRSGNAWSYNSTPQYAFMAWCSVKKSRGTTLPLTFYIN
jgi:hypothetical protein